MSLPVGEPSYVIPAWSLGDRLRKARRVTGLSQIQFAQQLGENAKSFASWESDNSVPRNLVALAKKVEMISRVPATWILGLADSAVTSPDTTRYPTTSAAGRPRLALVTALTPSYRAVPAGNTTSPDTPEDVASSHAPHWAVAVNHAHTA